MSKWTAIGRVRPLLQAMEAEPERFFTAKEAAKIMECRIEGVGASIKGALTHKAMFCKSFGRGTPMVLRGTPIPPEFVPLIKRDRKPSQTWKEGKERIPEKGWLTDPNDPRIGKVVENWKPPVMRHVRGGA